MGLEGSGGLGAVRGVEGALEEAEQEVVQRSRVTEVLHIMEALCRCPAVAQQAAGLTFRSPANFQLLPSSSSSTTPTPPQPATNPAAAPTDPPHPASAPTPSKPFLPFCFADRQPAPTTAPPHPNSPSSTSAGSLPPSNPQASNPFRLFTTPYPRDGPAFGHGFPPPPPLPRHPPASATPFVGFRSTNSPHTNPNPSSTRPPPFNYNPTPACSHPAPASAPAPSLFAPATPSPFAYPPPPNPPVPAPEIASPFASLLSPPPRFSFTFPPATTATPWLNAFSNLAIQNSTNTPASAPRLLSPSLPPLTLPLPAPQPPSQLASSFLTSAPGPQPTSTTPPLANHPPRPSLFYSTATPVSGIQSTTPTIEHASHSTNHATPISQPTTPTIQHPSPSSNQPHAPASSPFSFLTPPVDPSPLAPASAPEHPCPASPPHHSPAASVQPSTPSTPSPPSTPLVTPLPSLLAHILTHWQPATAAAAILSHIASSSKEAAQQLLSSQSVTNALLAGLAPSFSQAHTGATGSDPATPDVSQLPGRWHPVNRWAPGRNAASSQAGTGAREAGLGEIQIEIQIADRLMQAAYDATEWEPGMQAAAQGAAGDEVMGCGAAGASEDRVRGLLDTCRALTTGNRHWTVACNGDVWSQAAGGAGRGGGGAGGLPAGAVGAGAAVAAHTAAGTTAFAAAVAAAAEAAAAAFAAAFAAAAAAPTSVEASRLAPEAMAASAAAAALTSAAGSKLPQEAVAAVAAAAAAAAAAAPASAAASTLCWQAVERLCEQWPEEMAAAEKLLSGIFPEELPAGQAPAWGAARGMRLLHQLLVVHGGQQVVESAAGSVRAMQHAVWFLCGPHEALRAEAAEVVLAVAQQVGEISAVKLLGGHLTVNAVNKLLQEWQKPGSSMAESKEVAACHVLLQSGMAVTIPEDLVQYSRANHPTGFAQHFWAACGWKEYASDSYGILHLLKHLKHPVSATTLFSAPPGAPAVPSPPCPAPSPTPPAASEPDCPPHPTTHPSTNPTPEQGTSSHTIPPFPTASSSSSSNACTAFPDHKPTPTNPSSSLSPPAGSPSDSTPTTLAALPASPRTPSHTTEPLTLPTLARLLKCLHLFTKFHYSSLQLLSHLTLTNPTAPLLALLDPSLTAACHPQTLESLQSCQALALQTLTLMVAAPPPSLSPTSGGKTSHQNGPTPYNSQHSPPPVDSTSAHSFAPPPSSQPASGYDSAFAPPASSQPGYDSGFAPPASSQPGYDSGFAPPASSQPGYDSGFAPPASSQPGYDSGFAPPASSRPAGGYDSGFQLHGHSHGQQARVQQDLLLQQGRGAAGPTLAGAQASCPPSLTQSRESEAAQYYKRWAVQADAALVLPAWVRSNAGGLGRVASEILETGLGLGYMMAT